MLVLKRKPLESFRVGPDVRITILSCDHNRVRIGIVAPDSVRILRDELGEFRFADIEDTEAAHRTGR